MSPLYDLITFSDFPPRSAMWWKRKNSRRTRTTVVGRLCPVNSRQRTSKSGQKRPDRM